MFLLVHYDDFEDIRELIDYETCDDVHSVPENSEDEYSEAENSEDEYSEAENSEDEPSENERKFVAIKISQRSLRNVPYGIIISKRWSALTFHMRVSPSRTRQLPFSSIADELTESIVDEIIEVIELKNDFWATYDDHWDCYCKTEDVCGCGCDPLHDGW